MKKLFVISFLMLLVSVMSFAQSSPNFTDASGKKLGLWEEKSPAGASKGEYVNDQKNGCWTSYALDGKLIRIENFKNAIRHGIAVDIDQRGYLVSEMYYVDNQLEGTAKKFFYGTNPASTIDYVHGKMNGMKKIYYENSAGKIMEESKYKDDLKDGPSNFYTIAGDPIAEYNYVNNQLQGNQKTYYPGKKIMSEQEFLNNLENGINKEYYENGTLKSEGKYVKGAISGLWIDYNEEGKKTAEGNFVDGMKEGKWSYYDADGKVIKTEKYVKGVVK